MLILHIVYSVLIRILRYIQIIVARICLNPTAYICLLPKLRTSLGNPKPEAKSVDMLPPKLHIPKSKALSRNPEISRALMMPYWFMAAGARAWAQTLGVITRAVASRLVTQEETPQALRTLPPQDLNEGPKA